MFMSLCNVSQFSNFQMFFEDGCRCTDPFVIDQHNPLDDSTYIIHYAENNITLPSTLEQFFLWKSWRLDVHQFSKERQLKWLNKRTRCLVVVISHHCIQPPLCIGLDQQKIQQDTISSGTWPSQPGLFFPAFSIDDLQSESEFFVGLFWGVIITIVAVVILNSICLRSEKTTQRVAHKK